jgi:hypothetical protein
VKEFVLQAAVFFGFGLPAQLDALGEHGFRRFGARVRDRYYHSYWHARAIARCAAAFLRR